MPDTSSIPHKFLFVLPIYHGIFSDYVNEEKFGDFLNVTLNYFSKKNKETNFDELINILNYLNECLSKIKNLPLDKIVLARKLNSAIKTKSQEAYVGNDGKFYHLIFSSVNVTYNAIKYAPIHSKNTQVNDTIFAYLSDEVKDFGNIILSLRNQTLEYNIIETKVADLIKNTTSYLNPNQVKQIRYDFVSQFHSGINDIEIACEKLLNTKDCYYPKSAEAQYSAILTGRLPLNTQNAPEILEKIHNEIIFSGSSFVFDSEDKINNFFNYFSTYVIEKNSQHSGISENFVDNLSVWLDKLSNNFQTLNPKSKIYNQLFYLVEKIIADPHFNSQKLFYISNTINTCLTLMETLLKQGYDSVDPFVNLFNQISKKEQISIANKSHFATELIQLGLTCLQHKACNATLVIKKFTEVCGTMVSNLASSGIDTRKSEIEKIENAVQQLLKNAIDKVSKPELKEIAINFIKKYSNETQLTEKCASLFNFTDCQVNIAKQVTTIIPPVAANQSISVNTENPVLIKENNDTSPILTKSELTLYAAAAAHGVGSGIINGLIQHFASKYSQNNEQTSQTKKTILYTSLVAHAALAATFPLMVYKIQEHINQGNEDEAQELMDNWLSQASFTFICNASLSLGWQKLSERTQSLSSPIKQRIARNTLPFAGAVFSLFNNPASTITQWSASEVSSFLTQFVIKKLKKLFANDIGSTVKIEENNVEMQTIISKTTNKTESTKKYQFLNKEDLKQKRGFSFRLDTTLSTIVFSLEKSKENDAQAKCNAKADGLKKEYDKNISCKNELINRLKKPSEMVNKLHELLMDENHDKACLVYTDLDEYKKVMGTTGSLFKLMQGFYDTNEDNLRTTLCKATSYVEAHNENFDPEILEMLKETENLLTTLLLNIRRFISIYNVSEAGYKGERIGEAKARLLRSEASSHELLEKNKRPTTISGESFNFNFARDSITSNDSGNSTLSSTDTASIPLEKHGLFRNGNSNFPTDTFSPSDTCETQALLKMP